GITEFLVALQQSHCWENLRFSACAPRIRPDPIPARTVSGTTNHCRRRSTTRNRMPQENSARHENRPCRWRYPGTRVAVPIAIDGRKKQWFQFLRDTDQRGETGERKQHWSGDAVDQT